MTKEIGSFGNQDGRAIRLSGMSIAGTVCGHENRLVRVVLDD